MVSRAEDDARGICQNPELASSFVNTRAPANCASVGSTAGSGCLSRLTLRLSLVRSTQILTRELLLGTTTIPEHHSVGCSTFAITPILSILCSSWCTLLSRGIATLRGVESEKGSASSFNWISYSPSIFPNPRKREGNSSFGNSPLPLSMHAIRLISSRSRMMGCPRRDLVRPFTT